MKRYSEIDSNLIINPHITAPGVRWHDPLEPCFQIYGLQLPKDTYEDGKRVIFSRLPQSVARRVNEATFDLYRTTAGGRIRFTTDSQYVAIRCQLGMLCDFAHMSPTGTSSFDLYVTEEGKCRYFKTFVPPWDVAQHNGGYESILHFNEKKLRDVTLHFPLYNNVDALMLGLEADAKIAHSAGYRMQSPVVYYGSSITQGACASRPGNTYQSILSRTLNLDQVNLGFSNSAHGDVAMAEYIASLDMCAFVMDYDYNAPTPEHLSRTHYPFYRIVRDAKPDVPILCLSSPSFRRSEEFSRRRETVMNTVARGIQEGDTHIEFVDGELILGMKDNDCCTVDALHPNDLGFYRMAEAVTPVLAKMLGMEAY